MAGKEAIIVVLDCSVTMGKTYSSSDNSSKTRLDLAKEALNLLIQQKLLFSKSHEIGIVLFGTRETVNHSTEEGNDCDNVTDFLWLGKPNLDYIRKLEEIEVSNIKGDWISGLVDGMSMLFKHVGKKKYNKRIFIITDGESPASDPDDLDRIASELNDSETKVNVIAIDFCGNLDNNDDSMVVDSAAVNETKEQHTNRELFMSLASKIQGAIFPASLAMNIYKQFRKKAIYPVTKFRGPLEISPDLKIEVAAYGKAREATLPSLKKHSLVTNPSKDAEAGKVKMERVYTVIDDVDQDPVPDDMRLHAYYYGKQLVPISKEDESQLKYLTERCIKMIGFVDLKTVPRHYFIGSVDILVGSGNKENHAALSAIIHAMLETNKAMIVRYVPRANAPPKLAIATPYISSKHECLYINTLPTMEDLRDYQFSSLKASTRPQDEAAKSFVDSLDLMTATVDEDGETYESLKPSLTFNPVLQYFYQCLVHRTFNDDEKALPTFDENISAYVRPDRNLFEKAKKEVDAFAENFELTFKSDLENIKKKKVYWRDLLKQEEERKEVGEAQPIQMKLSQKDDKLGFQGTPTEISSINPIGDFNKMINEKTVDLVENAIKQMQKLIRQLVLGTIDGDLYSKALECLSTLREGCVREDEGPAFNTFIKDLKDTFSHGKHLAFWKMVIGREISLIDERESRSSRVTPDEKKEFLTSEGAQSSKDSQKKDKLTYEDSLMADIE